MAEQKLKNVYAAKLKKLFEEERAWRVAPLETFLEESKWRNIESDYDIAKDLGCSRAHVTFFRRKHGIPSQQVRMDLYTERLRTDLEDVVKAFDYRYKRCQELQELVRILPKKWFEFGFMGGFGTGVLIAVLICAMFS